MAHCYFCHFCILLRLLWVQNGQWSDMKCSHIKKTRSNSAFIWQRSQVFIFHFFPKYKGLKKSSRNSGNSTDFLRFATIPELWGFGNMLNPNHHTCHTTTQSNNKSLTTSQKCCRPTISWIFQKIIPKKLKPLDLNFYQQCPFLVYITEWLLDTLRHCHLLSANHI